MRPSRNRCPKGVGPGETGFQHLPIHDEGRVHRLLLLHALFLGRRYSHLFRVLQPTAPIPQCSLGQVGISCPCRRIVCPPGRASQCEECGECEEVCPQKLPIQDLLKEVTSEMEGPFFNTKVWLFSKYMRFNRWKAMRSGRA